MLNIRTSHFELSGQENQSKETMAKTKGKLQIISQIVIWGRGKHSFSLLNFKRGE